MIGEGVGFEHRRITRHLVGTLDRFNNGKRAEEHDRVKHSVPSCCSMRQEHRLMEGKIRIARYSRGVHCGRPRLPYIRCLCRVVRMAVGLPQSRRRTTLRAGRILKLDTLLKDMCRNPFIKGVTFSGGEPFCRRSRCISLLRWS